MRDFVMRSTGEGCRIRGFVIRSAAEACTMRGFVFIQVGLDGFIKIFGQCSNLMTEVVCLATDVHRPASDCLTLCVSAVVNPSGCSKISSCSDEREFLTELKSVLPASNTSLLTAGNGSDNNSSLSIPGFEPVPLFVDTVEL